MTQHVDRDEEGGGGDQRHAVAVQRGQDLGGLCVGGSDRHQARGEHRGGSGSDHDRRERSEAADAGRPTVLAELLSASVAGLAEHVTPRCDDPVLQGVLISAHRLCLSLVPKLLGRHLTRRLLHSGKEPRFSATGSPAVSASPNALAAHRLRGRVTDVAARVTAAVLPAIRRA